MSSKNNNKIWNAKLFDYVLEVEQNDKVDEVPAIQKFQCNKLTTWICFKTVLRRRAFLFIMILLILTIVLIGLWQGGIIFSCSLRVRYYPLIHINNNRRNLYSAGMKIAPSYFGMKILSVDAGNGEGGSKSKFHSFWGNPACCPNNDVSKCSDEGFWGHCDPSRIVDYMNMSMPQNLLDKSINNQNIKIKADNYDNIAIRLNNNNPIQFLAGDMTQPVTCFSSNSYVSGAIIVPWQFRQYVNLALKASENVEILLQYDLTNIVTIYSTQQNMCCGLGSQGLYFCLPTNIPDNFFNIVIVKM